MRDTIRAGDLRVPGAMLAFSLRDIEIFGSQYRLPVLPLMAVACSVGWALAIGECTAQYRDKKIRPMPFLHQKWTFLNKKSSTLLV